MVCFVVYKRRAPIQYYQSVLPITSYCTEKISLSFLLDQSLNILKKNMDFVKLLLVMVILSSVAVCTQVSYRLCFHLYHINAHKILYQKREDRSH